MSEMLRKARGEMSCKDVANKLGISQSALSMYESGKRVPRDELKVRMAKLYNTTVGHLFLASKFTIREHLEAPLSGRKKKTTEAGISAAFSGISLTSRKVHLQVRG